jgi:hypothetical protein
MNGNYAHIAANATVPICNHSCTLINVTINNLGTTGNTVTLYDTASGTATGNIIAVIGTTATIGVINFQCSCLLGLTAVMGTGVAGDITIVFS